MSANFFRVLRFAIPLSLIMWAIIIYGLVLSMSGCAMAPDVVRPEVEHMSHATQHEPFTNRPTRYGTNLAGVTAQWNISRRWQIEVNESVALPGDAHAGNYYGEIAGPRESFSARVGYNFEVRK